MPRSPTEMDLKTILRLFTSLPQVSFTVLVELRTNPDISWRYFTLETELVLCIHAMYQPTIKASTPM